MRAAFLIAPLLLSSGLAAFAQTATPLKFDVASVKQNKGEDFRVSSNVPLGPGNVYVTTGGVLRAKNWSLDYYVHFAYRMSDAQVQFFRRQAPAWVLADRFDIEAKTDRPDVTKDELRLMMRTLLAERFAFKVHPEVRELPVYDLLMVKPGTMGPGLRVHPEGVDCAAVGKDLTVAGKAETVSGGFVSYCGGITGMQAVGEGNARIGASRVPMRLIADSLTLWGELGKPAIDRTGLVGMYDFVLEYAPLSSPDREAEASGDQFSEALKKQLGLRLEASKGPVELLILDHVGRLTEN